MYYDVLVNTVNSDFKFDEWYAVTNVPTYSCALSLCKKEIKSVFSFVYIRKCFTDKSCKEIKTNFKLITSTSYTFTHFHPDSDFTNKLLIDFFNKADKKDYSEV